MIRVTIESLVKAYEGVAVVDGASLEVRPGELLVVLGPSGAGKTTLARLITGLERPDSGDVRFENRSILDARPEQRRIGFVPQEDALWPQMKVSEIVGYGPKVGGIARRDRRNRVFEAMSAARIDGLADRHPEGLSPLQRRRVAMARALVVDPQLLLLDEPMHRLDARARAELRDEIRRLHSETETTTLLLTSDPREALAMADRLAVMDLGRIVQSGPPGEVYNRPADALVAQLLGPANLLQGQAESGDARGEVIVKTPLGRLIGSASGGSVAAGTPVTVMIRPETLGLHPPVPTDANRFAATVERQVFLGATRQVWLRGPGDWPITAMALQGPSQGLREGQGLTVSVLPEHVVVLPGKAAGAGS